MAYTARDALNTILKYLNITMDDIEVIDDTNNRGFIYTLPNQEKCVISIYPISHKADGSKNFFDTRDSGATERSLTWKYACKQNFKYFCLAVHDQVEKYENFIFSLECDEKIVQKVSGMINGVRRQGGTQVVIPNDYIPSKNFDRFRTKNKFWISVIKKNSLIDYLEKFDNRPYMMTNNCNDGKFDYIAESSEKTNYGNSETLHYDTGLKIKYACNRIIFGAPGTGKSWKLNDECKKLKKKLVLDDSNIERITFYPDYMYSQFVGAYKPVTNDTGEIQYEFVAGPFMKMYVNALKSAQTNEPKPYLLIIEEINRARVASVFGDVFQLLDRNEDGVSEYAIQTSEDIRKYLARELEGNPETYSTIRLPNNMFIWATMNSADQGVFPMDTAFKRRWNFEYLGIDDNEDKVRCNVRLADKKSEAAVNWNQLRKAINTKLMDVCRINEDKLMGPFFLSQKVLKSDENGYVIDEEAFRTAFKSKVIMYLFEDAARQYRYKLFKSNVGKTYSSICKAFDEIGMDIFGDDFKSVYYDQQKG